MINKTEFNSFLYELYKTIQLYGHLINNMKDVQIMFDDFYTFIEEEKFDECKVLLQTLTSILGQDNPHIVRARTTLEFEMN